MSDEIVMYVTTWCSDCRRAKAVLDAQRIPYRTVNIEEDPDAAEYVMQVNNGYRSVPTIMFPDGSVLVEPGTRQLVDHVARLARPGVRLYRKAHCNECDRLGRLLDALDIAYEAVDIEADPQAAARLVEFAHGHRSVPTLVFPDGTALVEPSLRQLAEKLED